MADINVAVIIPTLNASTEIKQLIELLKTQTLSPADILVIDSSSDDDTVAIAKAAGARTYVIKREDFNHGATRHMALTLTNGDYVCFLTQDAVPANKEMLKNLIEPMRNDPQIALVYGRQIPKSDARRMEQLVRNFNYPNVSHVRTKADINEFGIKTYFASDVCAAYCRNIYMEMGGFPVTDTGEDWLMASRCISNGYKVAYSADAQVYHSHNNTLGQQYRRNYHTGRMLELHKGEFASASEISSGGKLVKAVAIQLLKEGRIAEFFAFGFDCCARLFGDHSGRASVSRITYSKEQ